MLHVAPLLYARLTRLALWALTFIVVTGATVRLTGSGLGCPDWPTCEQDSLLPPLEYHAQVEFLNRLVTGLVAMAVTVAVLGSWRREPRRLDLLAWSLGLVAGVAGQVLLGALLVKTELDPRFVMGHFLLSMVLLWNAAVLDARARAHASADSTADTAGGRVSAADSGSGNVERSTGRGTRYLLIAVFVTGAAVLVAGALVTGSGPHAGDTRAERLPLLVREVVRAHSVIAMLLLLLVVLSWLRLRSIQPERARGLRLVAMLLVVQGIVGYAQYFSGLPPLLVGVHVAMASVIWIGIVRATLPASKPRSELTARGVEVRSLGLEAAAMRS